MTEKYSRTSHRQTRNEFVVDTQAWERGLPDAVEAFFGRPMLYLHFLHVYQLNMTDLPHLSLDIFDWKNPFSLT